MNSFGGSALFSFGGLAKKGSLFRESNCAREPPVNVYVAGHVPSCIHPALRILTCKDHSSAHMTFDNHAQGVTSGLTASPNRIPLFRVLPSIRNFHTASNPPCFHALSLSSDPGSANSASKRSIGSSPAPPFLCDQMEESEEGEERADWYDAYDMGCDWALARSCASEDGLEGVMAPAPAPVP